MICVFIAIIIMHFISLKIYKLSKVAKGNYEAGKKVGKWFFWEGDSLQEVDYIDSKIVSVNKWDNKTKLAVRNR